MTKHGHVHWSELMTRDVAGAKAFYSQTLGWTFDEMPIPNGGTYYLAQSGGGMVGGMFQISEDDPAFADMPTGWVTYIAVDDIRARLAKAISAGGRQLGETMNMPGIGSIAMLQQPDGALVGWMEPESGVE